LPEIPPNLGDYYGAKYYQIPSPAKLEKIARAECYKLDMIQNFVATGRLLEIGPAYGVFAYQAKKAGFEVDVIEMDIRCCEYLTNVVDVNVINSDSPHQAIKKIGMHHVIALWHVIEHLPNPWACLESAAKNLVQGGVLVIATPNPSAFQFSVLGSSWPHVDAPRHLYLIPANLLIQRLKPFGLEPVMLTSNDKGAQSWNRFGWQRYLMNLFSNKLAQTAAFILGYIVSLPMGLWERRDFNGSAYTIILQKKVDQ